MDPRGYQSPRLALILAVAGVGCALATTHRTAGSVFLAQASGLSLLCALWIWGSTRFAFLEAIRRGVIIPIILLSAFLILSALFGLTKYQYVSWALSLVLLIY